MEKSAKESWNILGRAPKCLRYSGSSVDKGPGPVVSAPPGAPTLPSHSQGDTPKCCAGSRREGETHVTKVSTTGGVRIQRENKGRETEQRKHILVIRKKRMRGDAKVSRGQPAFTLYLCAHPRLASELLRVSLFGEFSPSQTFSWNPGSGIPVEQRGPLRSPPHKRAPPGGRDRKPRHNLGFL